MWCIEFVYLDVVDVVDDSVFLMTPSYPSTRTCTFILVHSLWYNSLVAKQVV